MTESANVSVIIPALNEEYYIDQTLHSLYGPRNYSVEVVVVDCSQNRHTEEAVLKHVRALDIKYLRMTVQDIGYQRNSVRKLQGTSACCFLMLTLYLVKAR